LGGQSNRAAAFDGAGAVVLGEAWAAFVESVQLGAGRLSYRAARNSETGWWR
jgi:hypothetical protein